MKKLLLTILAIFMSVVPMMADTQKLTYAYCSEPSQGVGVKWQEYTMLVEFPETFVEKFAGSRIVAVDVASPASYMYDEQLRDLVFAPKNNFTDVDLCFYSEKSFSAEPFYKQAIKLSSENLTWETYELTTPQVIEKGKPFFVGYTGQAPTTDDTCFAVDMDYNSSDYSCWIGWKEGITQYWEKYAEWYGNMCLRLVIEGDNLPVNGVTLNAMLAPGAVVKGEPFSVQAAVVNNAANTINNVTLEYTSNGTTRTVVGVLEEPIEYAQEAAFTFDGLVCDEVSVSGAAVNYRLVAINGESDIDAIDETGGEFIVRSLPAGVGYPRAVVIEEGTGTWCGNCPIGIVAMRYMVDVYGDDEQFIPVAIHYDDRMESETYVEVANKYFNSYPSAVLNRDTVALGLLYPEMDMVDFAYRYAKEITAIAKIEAEANFNEDNSKITVNTKTNFALETGGKYSVAVAFTQNNVGPYRQENYFADYAEGIEMGGFEQLPEKVEMTFDEVGVSYNVIGELAGSAPGVEYTLNADVAVDKALNVHDFEMIAMVINNENGMIENAVKVNSDKIPASISDVAAGSRTIIKANKGLITVSGARGTTTVYTIVGTQVATSQVQGDVNFNLGEGIYIVKSGDEVAKVVVK